MQHDPRHYRISEHFVLSDFLGCHSVYSKGLPNPFKFDRSAGLKLDNLRCLCEEALEPVMGQFGGLSVAYGYISPELSKRIVTYQDPDKPSHHRFDLGAAADICVHTWVRGEYKAIVDLYLPESAMASPIALAHGIEYLEIPYSRMITYSESPCICLAVAAKEFIKSTPRKAFYENRYQGKKKAKPDYRQYSTPVSKERALHLLQTAGLEVDWRGAGYPTYHGGGFQQYQHMRVSKYTMVSDWLFDLQSISNGEKNVPSLNLESVQDAFAAAGLVYDKMIEVLEVPRLSIVSGYVSPANPYFKKDNDWREKMFSFAVNVPESMAVEQAADDLNMSSTTGTQYAYDQDGFLLAVVDVEGELNA